MELKGINLRRLSDAEFEHKCTMAMLLPISERDLRKLEREKERRELATITPETARAFCEAWDAAKARRARRA